MAETEPTLLRRKYASMRVHESHEFHYESAQHDDLQNAVYQYDPRLAIQLTAIPRPIADASMLWGRCLSGERWAI